MGIEEIYTFSQMLQGILLFILGTFVDMNICIRKPSGIRNIQNLQDSSQDSCPIYPSISAYSEHMAMFTFFLALHLHINNGTCIWNTIYSFQYGWKYRALKATPITKTEIPLFGTLGYFYPV